MSAQEFRKKPVVISAVQWTGNNLREIITFTDGPPETRSVHAGMAWETYEDLVRRDGLKIFTLEGMMNADIGDWIIKGVKGEHYPCKPDIFAATYEAITGKGVMPDATSDVRPPATSPGVTAGAAEAPMWCDACRAVGAYHCAHPDECGYMLSATAAADNWKAWIDDLPLPEGFDLGAGRLQDFITALVVRIDVPQPVTTPATAGAVGPVITRLTIEPDMSKVREMLDDAEAKWAHLGTIAATIRVNTLRHGGTHEQADAFIRGEDDFIGWLSAKLQAPPAALDDPKVRKLVEALTLAANRMAWLGVQFDTGSREFIAAGEWTDEARAALRDMEGA